MITEMTAQAILRSGILSAIAKDSARPTSAGQTRHWAISGKFGAPEKN